MGNLSGHLTDEETEGHKGDAMAARGAFLQDQHQTRSSWGPAPPFSPLPELLRFALESAEGPSVGLCSVGSGEFCARCGGTWLSLMDLADVFLFCFVFYH